MEIGRDELDILSIPLEELLDESERLGLDSETAGGVRARSMLTRLQSRERLILKKNIPVLSISLVF